MLCRSTPFHGGISLAGVSITTFTRSPSARRAFDHWALGTPRGRLVSLVHWAMVRLGSQERAQWLVEIRPQHAQWPCPSFLFQWMRWGRRTSVLSRRWQTLAVRFPPPQNQTAVCCRSHRPTLTAESRPCWLQRLPWRPAPCMAPTTREPICGPRPQSPTRCLDDQTHSSK